MEKHLQAHDKNASLSYDPVKMHRCTVCSKHFTRKDSLEKHMKIHSGIKPFSCEVENSLISENIFWNWIYLYWTYFLRQPENSVPFLLIDKNTRKIRKKSLVRYRWSRSWRCSCTVIKLKILYLMNLEIRFWIKIKKLINWKSRNEISSFYIWH